MPKRATPLNAKQLEKWHPDPRRTLELIDGAVAGLRVRLSPHGEMSWSLSAHVDGMRRRIALGKGLGLAEARRKAEAARSAIAKGARRDPDDNGKSLELIGAEMSWDDQGDAQPTAFHPDDRGKRSEFSLHIGC